jgi:hypothetical protein
LPIRSNLTTNTCLGKSKLSKRHLDDVIPSSLSWA